MRVTVLAIALGAVLRWPALLAPFHSDDYQQLAMLRGQFVLQRASWDLFWFGPRSSAELRALQDFGFDPWWTAADHRLSMLRPLSSLAIWLDHRVFGLNPLPWHMHSLVWWAALIGAASILLHRLLPKRVAAVAVVFFALHAAHDVPLAWLANRSTLIAATFGVLGMLAHLRARDAGEPGTHLRLAALSALCFAASLAAGEYAFGMLAYLVAFELFGARGTTGERVRALLPALVLAATFLLVRSALGYGVRGSGMYIGPSEPLRFLAQVGTHVPVLGASLVLGLPTAWFQAGPPWRDPAIAHGLLTPQLFDLIPTWQATHVVLGVIALLAAVLAVRWLTGRDQRELAPCRWLAAGSLLALLSAAGADPSPRLLGAPALGACALLAALLVRCLPALARRPRRALAGFCVAIALVHGVFAAQRAFAATAALRRETEAARDWALQAEIPKQDSDVEVVIVSASDFATAANLPWVRLIHGLPLPRSYRRLSGALQAHDLHRVSEHSLELEVLASDLRGAFAGSIYRPSEQGFVAGQRVELPRMTVDLLTVTDGNPWRLRFTFERALDDPALLFLHAKTDGLRRFVPPPLGTTLRLPLAGAPRP